MREITNVYDLISAYRDKQQNGHFFDSDTLKFFGERISEMRVLKTKAQIRDCMGSVHTCYVLSSLQRKHPCGPRRSYHYFDTATFDDVIPG